MAAPGLDALRRIEQAKQALAQALEAGCIAYANGATGQASPIVDDRFKGQGNGRFPPLSPAYAKAKRSAAPALRGGIKAAGRVVPRGGATGALPILVRTGALRQTVSGGRQHRIVLNVSGLQATIYFTNLPGYAVYHHTGAGRLPQRSPVQPNAADIAKFKAVVERVLRMRLGRARAGVAQPSDLAQNNVPRRAPP